MNAPAHTAAAPKTAAERIRRRLRRREERLNAARTINDPDRGTLGQIQRIESEPGSNKGLRWRAYGIDGTPLGMFKTSRLAINALCRDRNVPEWFA
jgi:hypothetical protein